MLDAIGHKRPHQAVGRQRLGARERLMGFGHRYLWRPPDPPRGCAERAPSSGSPVRTDFPFEARSKPISARRCGGKNRTVRSTTNGSSLPRSCSTPDIPRQASADFRGCRAAGWTANARGNSGAAADTAKFSLYRPDAGFETGRRGDRTKQGNLVSSTENTWPWRSRLDLMRDRHPRGASKAQATSTRATKLTSAARIIIGTFGSRALARRSRNSPKLPASRGGRFGPQCARPRGESIRHGVKSGCCPA